MKVVVVGAGAMGGSFGGLLARAGHAVQLIDTWSEHVDAVRANGLKVDGAAGDVAEPIGISAVAGPADWAELAIVFVDGNNTRAGAETAKTVLADDGYAITCQNGVGNLEILQEVLGPDRVLGGSSMCSAMMVGPGHSRLTHLGPTTIGETGATTSARAEALAQALSVAGLPTDVTENIIGKIWTKLMINVAINALCATTGLRLGELARLPELDRLQDRVVDEALAVVAAKGIRLTDPDPRGTIKTHCWSKYSRPSMLQHIEAGRRTEIDTINGALVREGTALGLAMPYNEAVVALLKGREQAQIRDLHGPAPDYAALETAAANEERPV